MANLRIQLRELSLLTRRYAYRLAAELHRRQATIRTSMVGAVARLAYRKPVFEVDMLAGRLASAASMSSSQVIEGLIASNIDAHGLDSVLRGLDGAFDIVLTRQQRRAQRILLRAALQVLATRSLLATVDLGDRYIDRIPDGKATRLLARSHIDMGNIERPLALVDKLKDNAFLAGRVAKLRQEQQALGSGMPLARSEANLVMAGAARRALYFADQTRPHLSSGYAIRTHYLLNGIAELGWHVECFARCGYPNDRYDFRAENLVESSADVDGFKYHFRPERVGFRELGILDYHERAASVLVEQAHLYKPSIIHAASNHKVGLAGIEAARRLGIPAIYELRGLWHLTRSSVQPEYEASDHFRLVESLELQAARSADHVFTITGALRDLVIRKGVPASRVTILPNAVDSTQFVPCERDNELARDLGIGAQTVIGFIGTFKAYEGLDYLIEAGKRLSDEGHSDFVMLLVGDGPVHNEMVAFAERLGLGRRVLFTGRVPHDQIRRYYTVMDILAYPRRGVDVCEIIAPLKPLEAMAMQKAVVVSSVAALSEMVQDHRTGLVHRKDDAESLATVLRSLIANERLRANLASQARRYVVEERSWSRVAREIVNTYERLIGS